MQIDARGGGEDRSMDKKDTVEKNVGREYKKSHFDVLGLCCSSEVPLIEKILGSLEGVQDFSIIVPTKTLIVVHDVLLVSQIQIVKVLNEVGLEANVKAESSTTYKNKWPSPYAAASGLLLLLSFLKYIYSPLGWLAVGAIAAGIPPIMIKAIAAVRTLRLNINILVLITVSVSIVLHDYWEAGTIVFLFNISEWLESRATHKASAAMSSLVNMAPQRAVLAETGEEINADEVKLNTVVVVKAGEVIPVDGVVMEGNCEVDEKILTGESFPVAKQKDSAVWASSINLNGYVTIKTTAVAEDCMVARMASIVEEAQNRKSSAQRIVDKCAKYYTPAIVVISASIAVAPVAFHFQNKKQWYHLALVFLVSGCPCALLLSTPIAMFCALTRAATLGILFKGSRHLETLAQVKIMAFDKTGTITSGEFVVADFKPLQDNISPNMLLHWISSIESKSSHPMACALVEFARTHGVEPQPDRVDNFQNFPGEGICGTIEDNEIFIGNLKIALRAGCPAVPELEGYNVKGKSIGYIFLGASPAGIFCLSDSCRTGAKEAIKELKSLGIKTVMVTGDCHGAAKRTQEQLGGALDVIHAELLPQDKSRIIETLQRQGPTAMIGDGLNDAPALATADIGISVGISGSALAKESGDIILMSNDIQRIVKAYRTAKRVKRKIIENMIFSISTKAAIVGLAIAGHPLVWAAVLADVGTCLLVIFNSMMLLPGTSTRGKPCCQSTHKSPCCDIESQKHCKQQSCFSKKCDISICGSPGLNTGSCATRNVHCCQQNEATVTHKKCCQNVAQDSEIDSAHSHGCTKSLRCGEKSEVHFEHHEHSINYRSPLKPLMSDEQSKSHKHGMGHPCEGHGKAVPTQSKEHGRSCSKNGQLEASSRGSLSEIIVD